ncbi:hypothetical protein [Bradyrhizobium japonicum]|uniref:hypothetical protein n=1 Tax=Bradyrhizobium japonicum TaxID=375 RepID=UPI0033922C90
MRSMIVFVTATMIQLLSAVIVNAQNACETKNVFGTDSAGKTVPIETYVGVSLPTLVSKVLYAVDDPQFVEADQKFPAGKVAGSLKLSLVIDATKCPIFPSPLGIVFKNATVSVNEPLKIEVSLGQGRANVSFDQARFAATLSEIIPLPPGFSYQTELTDTPENANGLGFSVSVAGPEPIIGEVIKFDLVLDIGQKDFGLVKAAEAIGVSPADLASGRQKAVEAIRQQFKKRIESNISAKKIEFERLVASSPRIDWEKWDRGDQSFSVTLEWKDVDPIFGPILPATAELRIDGSGNPQLSFPPIDAEKFRALLAAEVGARLTDNSLLEKIAKRFGDIPSKTIPGGWLRIRNIALTQTWLSAEVAFAITDQAPNWQKLRVDFPAKKEALASVAGVMAASANAVIKKYLETIAKDAVYQAVVEFVDNNKTLQVFGQPFLIELVKKGLELPPVPLINLKAQAGDIAINNVGITIQNKSPRLDWTNATITGERVLADQLFKATGLQRGDLGLTFTTLQFANGRLTGVLEGNVWGSAFSIPFSIGEKDTKISLPGVHQQLVSKLQQTLDNKKVSAFGLQLFEFKMCPDGPASGYCSNNGLGASAKFEVQNIFSGVVAVRLYPSLAFELKTIQPLGGFASLTGLFQSGAVTVDLPPASLTPLVVSGTIDLANLWDVIPIPPIPYKWSAQTGKVTLSFPTVIPIDTDIFIPPGLNLSQVRIPISAAPDGSLTVGLRITVGEHYVQYIFNIDGTVRGNPKDTTVSVLGSVSLISIPLYEVDGKVDFPKTHIHVKSQTKGLLKAILPQEGLLDISGKECLAWQRDDIQFLFFKLKSDLLFQVPAAACNRPLSKRASDCGIPSGGGACIKATASAGALGDMDAQLLADLNLRFKVAANANIGILNQNVKLGLEGSERLIVVNARVLGMKFGFSIQNPGAGSDRVIKDLLEALVKKLLQPKIEIPKSFSLSTANGDTTVEVEASEDGGPPSGDGDKANTASASAQQPATSAQKDSGQVQAGKENGGAPPGKENAGAPPANANEKDQRPPIQAVNGDSEVDPFEIGPIVVRFEKGVIVETNRDTGVTRRSTSPAHDEAIAALRSKCKVYGWYTKEFGSGRVNPADADGAILATSIGCNVPPKCSADQLCALPLRVADQKHLEAAPVAPKLKWRNIKELVSGKVKASGIDTQIILETARAATIQAESNLPLGGEWQCFDLQEDKCSLAIETNAPNDGRAFGSERAGLLPLQPGSFLHWTAEQSDDAFTRPLFKAADDDTLTVYGRTDLGWLVDSGNTAQIKGRGILLKQNRKFIPVGLSGEAISPLSGFSTNFGRDALLANAIDTIAKDSRDLDLRWSMHRIKSEEGRRLFLSSTSNLYLFAEPPAASKPVLKTIALNDLGDGPNGCFDTSIKDPLVKIARIQALLELKTDDWRSRGIKTNPVALIFEQACRS